MKHYILLIVLVLFCQAIHAQQVNEPKGSEEWSKDYSPFRIVGNLYYVGTYDLGCYLITTSKGHILINTGLASSASQIEKHVKELGFNFNDIKILLTTQAHFDHLGAMAAVKKTTGAKLMVNEQDAPIVADGGLTDYAFGGKVTFAPVQADRLLKPNDIVQLGEMNIKMLHHPGHTKGSCSYLFTVKDDRQAYQVLIANLPTIVTDKKLSDVASYPSISQDLASTFSLMKNISFDLWVASHASQFNLHAKHKPGDAYNPNAFRDKAGYDKQLADLEKEYQLKK